VPSADVVAEEPAPAGVTEPVDPGAVQVTDANAVTAVVEEAADSNAVGMVDPNASELADAMAVAPVEADAVKIAGSDTDASVDADTPKLADARPADSAEERAEAPSEAETASPSQDGGEETAALYGSIESYGCINQADPRAKPVYHFTSESLTPHFYTISREERDKLINESPDTWTYEGRAFKAYPEGQQPEAAIPVYRFWSNLLGTHFYTMNEEEKDAFIKDYPDLCAYQGVAWYTDKLPPSEPSGTRPQDEP
jgi:uncharacterized protein DUF5648